MSSLLLTLAAATPADGDNALVKITQDFGINLPSILAQMVSFSVVAYVLWKFAFKPVMATMDERQKQIASGLQYAEVDLSNVHVLAPETGAPGVIQTRDRRIEIDALPTELQAHQVLMYVLVLLSSVLQSVHFPKRATARYLCSGADGRTATSF